MSLAGILLPPPRRAYPTGWHDRLIKAAVLPDADRALDHATAWLAANDIDHAPFRDHRLLVAVTARFGERLSGYPAYPRLVGLRRMLWTRSVMALREALPALAAIAKGSQVLLIKGAARLVDQRLAAGERVAHDIDIVVRPGDMHAAFGILVGHDWIPAYGVSQQYLREHLAAIRAVNMFKGNFGDIDLHSRPFHPGQGTSLDDEGLWRRSVTAWLDHVPVRIPGPEDRLVLSIAHGGLDAHAHSDWMVDAAAILAREAVDWLLVEDIIRQRALSAPAVFALGYLMNEAGFNIPEPVLERIGTAAEASYPAYLSGFLQARPRERATAIGNTVRAVAKFFRKRAARREQPRLPDRWLSAKPIAINGAADDALVGFEQRIDVPAECRRGRARLRAVLLIAGSPLRRRIELEINGRERHIGRVRYRKMTKSARPLALLVEGIVELPHDEPSLMLVSRPSRLLRRYSAPAQKARYDALPFRSLSVSLSSLE